MNDFNASLSDASAATLAQILLNNNAGISIFKLDANGNFKAIGAEEHPENKTDAQGLFKTEITYSVKKC